MGRPPRHGQLSLTNWKPAHAKAHLAATTSSMAEVKDYGGHGCFSSQGAMSQGGAAGADYQTASGDSVGDADSAGATGY